MDDPDPDERLLGLEVARSPHRSRRRLGLTLPELLAAMVIVAVLSALVTPIVMGRLRTAHGDAIIDEMTNLQNALRMFYRDVGRYPRQLNYLVALEDLNGVRTTCNAAIATPNQARYRGPYLNRHLSLLDPYGIPTPNTRYIIATDDSIEATLARTIYATVSGGTQQALQILVYGPDEDIVEYIDKKVDGDIDGGDGTVRYTTPLNANDNEIRWTIPIVNGIC